MAKCKILFLAANPEGTSQLALDMEIREIDAKIRASDFRDSLQLVSHWGTRPDDLLQFLNQHKPQVVHFSGHGSQKNEILLLSDTGSSHPVSRAALRELFRTLKDNIRVVVLNACFSRGQAEVIVENIDCAVGMNKAIGDQAAITFAASFYRALGFGRSVQQAFEQGKTALMLAGISEEDTPELILRAGVDAAKIVLAGGNADAPSTSTINGLFVTRLNNTVGFITHYLENLLRLVQSPKQFITHRIAESNADLKESLIFMASSVLIGWLLKISFVRGNAFLGLASDIVAAFMIAIAYGVALCLAWHVLKGKARLKEMLAVHFYYWGVVELLQACWFMSIIGAFRASDAALYKVFMESLYNGSLLTFGPQNIERILQSSALLPIQLIAFTGLTAILVWLYAGWGAYRQINDVSKLQSVLAAILFVLFCIPITAVLFLIANAGAAK